MSSILYTGPHHPKGSKRAQGITLIKSMLRASCTLWRAVQMGRFGSLCLLVQCQIRGCQLATLVRFIPRGTQQDSVWAEACRGKAGRSYPRPPGTFLISNVFFFVCSLSKVWTGSRSKGTCKPNLLEGATRSHLTTFHRASRPRRETSFLPSGFPFGLGHTAGKPGLCHLQLN